MPKAHYFETQADLDGDKLQEILAAHGIRTTQHRSVDPKHAGVVLTPMTIRRAWDHTTDRDHCEGQCRDSGRPHRSWDELDEGQRKEFRKNLIRSMNNSWLHDYRPDVALADSPFFPGVALGACNNEQRIVIRPEDDTETVLGKLEDGHHECAARRIRYLKQIIEEDENEGPVNLDSLRRFAHFMLENRPIGTPSVSIDHSGLLGLEWHIPHQERPDERADADLKHWGKGDGILAIVFLPSGLVRFAGTSGPAGQGIERLKVSGTYTPSGTLAAVQPFLSRLEIQ